MKQLKNVYTILSRCFLLYLAAIVVLLGTIDHRGMNYQAMDHFRSSSEYLMGLVRGDNEVDPRALRDALRYYDNMVRVNPNFHLVQGARALCYYYLRDINRAIFYYRHAIDLDPKCFGFYYNLGVLYFREKDYRSGIAFFEQAIKIPREETFNYPMIIYPEKIEDSLTDDEIGRLGVGPAKAYEECYRAIIYGYEKLGDYVIMRLSALYAARLIRQNSYFYRKAGEASLKLDEYEKAIEFFQNCLKIDPDDIQASQGIVIALEKLSGKPFARNIQNIVTSTEQTFEPMHFVPLHFFYSDDKKLQANY